jgi:peroxiredoxin
MPHANPPGRDKPKRGYRMADKLDTGDRFPRMTLNLVGGGSLTLPDDLAAKYTVILFYRGHW